MKTLSQMRKILSDRGGQDMVEYALLSGFLAVIAGAALPDIGPDLGFIYFMVREYLMIAAGQ